jgi:C-terminal processing protease CtpA/Prc
VEYPTSWKMAGCTACAALCCFGLVSAADRVDLGAARTALRQVRETVLAKYYDPQFHGVVLRAKFGEAEKALASSQTAQQAFAIIARVLESLNDPHTRVYGIRAYQPYEPGWRAFFIGDRCLVTEVMQDSDAAKQGVLVGDELLELEAQVPERLTWDRRLYELAAIDELKSFRMKIRHPDGSLLEATAASKLVESMSFKPGPGNLGMASDPEYPPKVQYLHAVGLRTLADPFTSRPPVVSATLGNSVLVWRMSFIPDDLRPDQIDSQTRKRSGVILDLRGSDGSGLDAISALFSSFFSQDVHVGTLIERRGKRLLVVKSRGPKAFSAPLVLITDSRTRGTAEIFAQFVKADGRGVVIGDRTAGDGRLTAFTPESLPFDSFTFAASEALPHLLLEFTSAEILPADGQPLAGHGVAPDVAILPTPADVAAGRDPVLAKAALILGIPLNAEQAGHIFPK